MMKKDKAFAATHRGFTLVEVMVALVIVATAISALLVQIMGNVDNTAYLRNKTIAHWVALNQLELLYLENQHSNKLIKSGRSGNEEMAGQEWFWTLKTKKTANEGFLQLELSVKAEEDDESALVTVVGLIDHFHESKK